MSDDEIQAELSDMIDMAGYRPEYLPIDTAEPIVADAAVAYEAMVMVAKWQDWHTAYLLAGKLIKHLPTVPHYGGRYGFFDSHRCGVIYETYRRAGALLHEQDANAFVA
jgi:hypothetical protein